MADTVIRRKRSPKEKILERMDSELEKVIETKLTGALLVRIDSRSGGFSKMRVNTEECVDIGGGK